MCTRGTNPKSGNLSFMHGGNVAHFAVGHFTRPAEFNSSSSFIQDMSKVRKCRDGWAGTGRGW